MRLHWRGQKYHHPFILPFGLPWWLRGKEPTCNAGNTGLTPQLGRFPWSRKWQPTPVFLPEEFHEQRSLVGYSPRRGKELDTTEWVSTHTAHTCARLCLPLTQSEKSRFWIVPEVTPAHALAFHSLHCFLSALHPLQCLCHSVCLDICFSKTLVSVLPHEPQYFFI